MLFVDDPQRHLPVIGRGEEAVPGHRFRLGRGMARRPCTGGSRPRRHDVGHGDVEVRPLSVCAAPDDGGTDPEGGGQTRRQVGRRQGGEWARPPSGVSAPAHAW